MVIEQYEHRVNRAIRAGRMLSGQQRGDLEEASGISYNRIRYLESEGSKVPIDELQIIAKAQNLPLSFYIDGPGGTVVPRNYDNPGYLNSDEVITLPQYDLNELVDTAA